MKKDTIDVMSDCRGETDDPTITARPASANEAAAIAATYKRGAKKIEKLTGKKTKLPDWSKGELNFPPASEVAE